MTRETEVVVVGAGPAGSALAAGLGARGVRTLVVDRARFPRDKPCGDYLSPGAVEALERLGVLDEILALPHRKLFGHALHARDGNVARGRFAPVGANAPRHPWGLAVRRRLLDRLLLRRAATFPSVTVLEDCRVDGLLPGGGVRTTRGDFPARLVAGCDGINSVVARELGLARFDRKLRKVALVAYWRGFECPDRGEVHFGDGAYVALAPVDDETANLNLVVDASEAKAAGGDVERLYVEVVKRFPQLAARLRNASLDGPVRSTGPLARCCDGVVAPGAFLAGDSAEFVDPVTAEGVWMALRGSEVAAELVAEALQRTAGPVHLTEWPARRDAEFSERFRACRRFQTLLRLPRVLDAVIRRLAARPDLADLAVSVSGDYAPTSALLNLSTVISFLNPFSRAAAVECGQKGRA